MQKKTGTGICFILFVTFVCLLWVSCSEAQDYPKSPIQVVIPFAPGGGNDIFCRTISDFVGVNLGGKIVLVNKTGGGGLLGTSYVVNSKPDGYTLVNAVSDPLTIAPLFAPEPPYDTEKDLTYIAKLMFMPLCLCVRGDAPFKTIEELVAFAKANPRKLKAGIPGVGTTPHMIIELFNREAKIEITTVPFSGTGEMVPNLLGGHIDINVISVTAIKPHYLSGKIRILAMCSPKRLPDLPQISTMGEKGYKNLNIATVNGMAGPKGLAPAVVKKWEDALEKTLTDPKVIAMIDKLEGIVIDFKRHEAFRKEVLTDYATFKQIVPTIIETK